MATALYELGTRPGIELVSSIPTTTHVELAAVRALLIEGQFDQGINPVLSSDVRPHAIEVATNFFAINPQASLERVLKTRPDDLSQIHEVIINPSHAERLAQEDPGLAADFIGLLHIDAEINGNSIDDTALMLSDPSIDIPTESVRELQADLLGSTDMNTDGITISADETIFDGSTDSTARRIIEEAEKLGDGISLPHLLRTNRRIANDIMKLGLLLNNEGRGNHVTVPLDTLIEAQVRSSGNPRGVRKAIERLMKGG